MFDDEEDDDEEEEEGGDETGFAALLSQLTRSGLPTGTTAGATGQPASPGQAGPSARLPGLS
eukprot:8867976-Heterocapsa_arctica.AAC.1